ncbi:hypothetical protein PtrEW13061_009588 [Pyrenophora tritici-repentis]|nr:hypothetical protein PtrEW13061_009588 [Pyrenophora tritici-repentis]
MAARTVPQDPGSAPPNLSTALSYSPVQIEHPTGNGQGMPNIVSGATPTDQPGNTFATSPSIHNSTSFVFDGTSSVRNSTSSVRNSASSVRNGTSSVYNVISYACNSISSAYNGTGPKHRLLSYTEATTKKKAEESTQSSRSG